MHGTGVLIRKGAVDTLFSIGFVLRRGHSKALKGESLLLKGCLSIISVGAANLNHYDRHINYYFSLQ